MTKNFVAVSQKMFAVNEECGVFGIVSKEERSLAKDIYYGLFALQHRGQESAGMAVNYNTNKIAYYKNMGLVSEVFGEEELKLLPETRLGIGHVRYSTTGSSNVINAQPVVFYGRHGRIAVAHNGNIVNAKEIRENMLKEGQIFQSSTDTEVIAALINFYGKENVEEGIKRAAKELKGAYTLLVLSGQAIYAVRDKFGLKPLALGKNSEGDIIIASESCAIDAVEATFIRDVLPGELLKIDKDGEIVSTKMDAETRKACIFEYVYLARSDSVIDGRSVYESRYECGRLLAELTQLKADIVAGVPDSALVAARGFSEYSGIPYVDALSKNRYVGRTFIQPYQSLRENSVKIKLNAFRSNIKGKSLILIDDSIVRGTTTKKIIKLLRQNGAKEIHMLVASPPVCSSCHFGVDMSSPKELIAYNNSVEEIRKEIDADSLFYLPLELLKKACYSEGNDFCVGCFGGEYAFNIDKYL